MPEIELSLSEETFTQDELHDALENLTVWNFAYRNRIFNNGHTNSSRDADDIIRKIKENRTMEMDPKEEFTFTETELRAAHKLTGYTLTHSQKIIDTIKSLREPGTVVLDANGNWYQRTEGQQWLRFGTDVRRFHDIPKRPLTVKS